jgi:6-phosphogluconolactonase
MQFIQTTGWDVSTQALAKRLQDELAKKKQVLWLIGGGSNIAASVKIMDTISDEASEHLRIFMTDERYGELGHNNSNAKQLHDERFNPKQAMFMPMLSAGFTLEETQERYASALENAAEHADIIIAQFGIGPDGHIAGILPHTPATKATGWITAYEAPPYVRVTMTFDAIRRVHAAYTMAFGEAKQKALHKLQHEDLTLDEEPSQILKELPEAYVYNDQVGEKS